jgi:hypothetical protein
MIPKMMSRDDFVVYCSSLNTCREAFSTALLHHTSLLANCLEWVQWFAAVKVFVGFSAFADEFGALKSTAVGKLDDEKKKSLKRNLKILVRTKRWLI